MGMEALVLKVLCFLSVTRFILSLLAVTFHCNVGSKHQDGLKLVISKLRCAPVDHPKSDFVCFIESGVCEPRCLWGPDR